MLFCSKTILTWTILVPSLDPVEREDLQRALQEKLAKIEHVESSAMEKFLDFFLKPEFCNSSLIAHNSARVTCQLCNGNMYVC